jgi:hypothetical protein
LARWIGYHILAIGYAPAYRAENAVGIQDGWPRIPFPASADPSEMKSQSARELLQASAELGEQVARLLDPGSDVEGVTRAPFRRELANVAILRGPSGTPPCGCQAMTEPWGRRGGVRKNHPDEPGHILPGTGRLTARPYTVRERRELEAGALERQLSVGAAYAALGQETTNVYMNDNNYWANVPANVWSYSIGRYTVLRKWLGYRCADILGRSLTPEETEEFTRMARRLAALCLLEPALNRNYARIRDAAMPL